MKTIHLRPRLQALAERVEHGGTAADVGCDHGRLSLALLQSGRCTAMIASDISEASLCKARALARKAGLSRALRFVVSDGLSHLSPGEADTLLFAGMGGELIASLLLRGEAVAQSAGRIHMQPMGGILELRRFLQENGYRLLQEGLVKDAGRIYQILTAEPGAAAPPPPGFPAGPHAYGPLLFHRHDPLLLELLGGSRAAHLRRLETARKRGREPEALLAILNILDALIAWEENYEAE